MTIPRIVLVLELEAAPVLRVETLSWEDEAALLGWAARYDFAKLGADAEALLDDLRERRAA